MKKVNVYLLLLVVCLLLPLRGFSATEKLQSSLDRNNITLGETVQLILSSNQENIDQTPDITPLYKDFTIISTGENKQVSIVNGASAALTRWIITLMPKHEGNISIPSIMLGSEKTEPLYLQVNKSSIAENTTKHIYLVAEATPEKPFEQSQIIYIVRLFYDQGVQNSRFTEPSLDNAEMIHLQSDRSYEKMVGDHLYQVLERRYAIFPEKPGTFTIPGAIFTGNILQEDNNQTKRSLFYLGNWKTIRVAANPVTLQIQPPPANIKLGMWLPAQALTLKQSWSESPDELTVGKPITRTLTIEAHGLTAEQLPALDRWQPKGFKIYPDKPILKNSTDGKTIIGTRIEKYAFIPQTAGQTTVPKIKLHWWNTSINKMQAAILAEKMVNVKLAADAATAINPDITTTPPTAIPAQNQTSYRLWIFISAGLFFLWLMTLFLWWFNRKRHKKHSQQKQLHQQKETIQQMRKEIQEACYTNNLQQCKKALLIWANTLWPNNEIRNLGDIRKMIQDEEGKEILCELDMHLYTVDTDNPWDGKPCWKILEKLLKIKTHQSQHKEDTLPSLHPSHEEDQ